MRTLPLLIGSRLPGALAVVLGATVAVQLLLYLAPGDPISNLPDGESLRPVLAPRWGLDQPLPVRLGHTLARLASGDLGTSYAVRPGASVWEVLAVPAPASLARVVAATVLATVSALGLAVLRGSWPRLAAVGAATSLVPLFAAIHLSVLGANALAAFGLEAGWWTRPGWFALPIEPTWHREVLGVCLLAWASGMLDAMGREAHAALAEVSASPYVEATVLRGEPALATVVRNLVPVTLLMAARRVVVLLGGVVVLEKVLLLPGAGAVLWEAALLRDHELAMGIGVLCGVVVVSVRLGADLLAAAWDTRLAEER